MPEDTNYWKDKRLNRRQVLRGGLAVGAGAVGLSIGCSAGTPASPTPAPTKPAAAPTVAATPTPSKVVPKGKLTVAIGSLADELFDPPDIIGGGSIFYLNFPFETLVMRDLTGKLMPGLASKWTTADALTWDFDIQKGVKFHNGDPMTAEDVKFSFDRVMAAKGPQSVLVATPMESVQIVDDYKVRVKLKYPLAPWLTAVEAGLYVIPKKYYEKVGTEEFRKKPVGTGPFIYKDWKRMEYMQFEAVENHWRQTPYVKDVIFRAVPEAASRVAMLRAKEAEIAFGLPVAVRKEVEADSSLRLLINRDTSKGWCWFCGNSAKEGDKFVDRVGNPWNNKKVRQAANHAINRQAMADKLYQGFSKPAVTLTLPAEFGFNPDLKPYAYDPAKAKALLAEAGYASGFETEIAGGVASGDALQVIANFLTEVGIKTKVTTFEGPVGLQKVMNRELLGLFLLEAVFAMYDGWRPLFQYNKTGTFSMTQDLEMDKMITAIENEPNDAKREALIRAAIKKEYDDAQHLFLLYGSTIHGVSDKIIDWPQQAAMSIYKWTELIKMK